MGEATAAAARSAADLFTFKQNANTADPFEYNPRVFMDIQIGFQKAGRIIFELFDKNTPKTCENFRCLCTGEMGIGEFSKKPLHFKGMIFHRIIPGFMCQGGDFQNANGTGGLLSMANSGKNTNGSQFFITLKKTPHLDGKHVIFGKVVEGMEVVRQMEEVATKNDRPVEDVTCIHCGEMELVFPPGWGKQKKQKKEEGEEGPPKKRKKEEDSKKKKKDKDKKKKKKKK